MAVNVTSTSFIGRPSKTHTALAVHPPVAMERPLVALADRWGRPNDVLSAVFQRCQWGLGRSPTVGQHPAVGHQTDCRVDLPRMDVGLSGVNIRPCRCGA